MGCLSPEQVVAEGGVGEHQGQHDGRADEQQRLRRGCSGCLTEGDFERNQPRPEADPEADVAHQKHADTHEEGAMLPAPVQVPPDHDEQGGGQQRHRQEIEEVG